MWIDILATGSTGNAILINDGYTKLLLDAGLSFGKLSRLTDTSRVSGVLITHEHKDHCLAVEKLLERGNKCYMSAGTWKAGLWNNDVKRIRSFEEFDIGTWKVMAFPVFHDTAEPVGFICYSKILKKKLLYVIDTGKLPMNFGKLNYVLIECNYSEQTMSPDLHPAAKYRIRRSHLSLEDVIEFLGRCDKPSLEEIYLLHLSSRNANVDLFKSEVESATGLPVYTAE